MQAGKPVQRAPSMTQGGPRRRRAPRVVRSHKGVGYQLRNAEGDAVEGDTAVRARREKPTLPPDLPCCIYIDEAVAVVALRGLPAGGREFVGGGGAVSLRQYERPWVGRIHVDARDAGEVDL